MFHRHTRLACLRERLVMRAFPVGIAESRPGARASAPQHGAWHRVSPRAKRAGDLTRPRRFPMINSMSTVENLSERLELLQGTLEVLILRSLQAGANHAYGIAQYLKQQSGEEFAVDNGSLY